MVFLKRTCREKPLRQNHKHGVDGILPVHALWKRENIVKLHILSNKQVKVVLIYQWKAAAPDEVNMQEGDGTGRSMQEGGGEC